jgi:hypothetical protein
MGGAGEAGHDPMTAQSASLNRKRIVARRGCAVMFIVLWLTEALRNYFWS